MGDGERIPPTTIVERFARRMDRELTSRKSGLLLALYRCGGMPSLRLNPRCYFAELFPQSQNEKRVDDQIAKVPVEPICTD
jgi:hypothetical protein